MGSSSSSSSSNPSSIVRSIVKVVMCKRLIEQILSLCCGFVGGPRAEQVRNEHCWLEWSVTGNIWEILGGVSFECGDGSTVCPRILDPMVGSM